MSIVLCVVVFHWRDTWAMTKWASRAKILTSERSSPKMRSFPETTSDLTAQFVLTCAFCVREKLLPQPHFTLIKNWSFMAHYVSITTGQLQLPLSHIFNSQTLHRNSPHTANLFPQQTFLHFFFPLQLVVSQTETSVICSANGSHLFFLLHKRHHWRQGTKTHRFI